MQAETSLQFAIVRESWGWNLVRFRLDEDVLEVTFYECGPSSLVVSYLAYRVKSVANRQLYHECFSIRPDTGGHGTLGHVFEMLDGALGLPFEVVAALRKTRDARRSGCDLAAAPSDYQGRVPCQLPLGKQQDLVLHFHGLTVKFILDFSRALLRQSPTQFLDSQVKVVVLDSLLGLKDVACQALEAELSPTWIFVLCGHN